MSDNGQNRKRILLSVAYDGTAYSGFQAQKDPAIMTIAGTLDHAIRELTGEPVCIEGASRTDAGVHARGNLAVFDTESRIPPDKFAFALNTRLPGDIRVQYSREVRPDFHPRFLETCKTYEYHILNAHMEMPTKRLYETWYPWALDTAKMNQAASFLVGEHDFASFCSIYTQAKTTIRTVLEAKVMSTDTVMPREITIQVTGTGFLYNMVRIIAGTLLEVGRGRIAPEEIPGILAARDRTKAGPTAPACGLILAYYGIPADWHFFEKPDKITVDM